MTSGVTLHRKESLGKENVMKRQFAILAALASAICVISATSPALADESLLIAPDDIRFAAVDPNDPAAGEAAVLVGDPSQPGTFVMRLRLKAGSFVKAHRHSTAEYVTVHSGKARMSFGDVPDEAAAKPLVPGSFLYLPAGQTHSLWIDEDAVADLFSMGPFDEQYVQK
jgi:quercetin dioxygenase-like cupin family protein